MNNKSQKHSAEIRIPPEQMKIEFNKILIKHGFALSKAELCAQIFAENSLDGIYSHGVNRFARFVKYINEKCIDVNAEPEKMKSAGAVEQWDGHLGPGPLNALICTDRAIDLAKNYGIGCVALSNTNHWMRGGTYGWKAAKEGFLFIGWTNTKANMPAWGAVDARLGNNPLVFAAPYKSEAIVLDMAMSQFSYGKMEALQSKKEKLSVPGGYDTSGNITQDPSEILLTERPLPMGYWKGAGLALLLDIFAALLSGGLSTCEISKNENEFSMSQVFIAVDISQLSNRDIVSQTVDMIIEDYHSSAVETDSYEILYPGERVVRTRKDNMLNGIPVDAKIWQEIINL